MGRSPDLPITAYSRLCSLGRPNFIRGGSVPLSKGIQGTATIAVSLRARAQMATAALYSNYRLVAVDQRVPRVE